MKTRVFGVLMVAMVAILIMGACAGPTATPSPAPTVTAKPTPTASPTPTATAKPTPTATAAPLVLKMVEYHAPTHHHSLLAQQFAKLVEQRSQGRIKVDFYSGEEVVKRQDVFEAVSQGIFQIGATAPSYEPDKLILAGISNIPTGAPNATSFWTALFKLYETNALLNQEFAKYKLKPLYPFGASGFDFITTKKAVRTVEDLKGLKLRGSGGYLSATVAAVGAIPMNITSAESYTAMQRGTVDGLHMNIDTAFEYKIQEVSKYATLAESAFGSAVMVMNLDTWNKLTPDLQKIIDDTLKNDVFAKVMEITLTKRGEAIDIFKKAGVEMINFSPEEQKKLVAAIVPVREAWIKEVGTEGKTVLDAFLGFAMGK